MKTIPLRRRDGSIRALTRVDDADYERLSGMHFHLSVSGNGKPYARTKRTLLHRLITGLGPKSSDPREVDHIDGDGLNNQRHNLRIVTHAQNHQNRQGATATNRSGIRGVTWDKSRDRWLARGYLNGRQYQVGRFATLEDAERAVIAWRREHMPYSMS